MPEYIDRVDLIEKINTVLSQRKFAENTSSYFAFELFTVVLKGVPTADVVEVVRCKDCEHRYVPCHCALWYGTADGKEYFIERGDDFSCSYGEKKEGAEE